VSGGIRYYELGTTTPFETAGRPILGTAKNRRVLVKSVDAKLAILAADGEHVISGIDATLLVAARSQGDGFRIAAFTKDDVSVPNLYYVGVDGNVKLIGKYTLSGYRVGVSDVLEPDGALVSIVGELGGDRVMRSRVGAPPELVFAEAKQAIKIHGGAVMTGP